MEKRISIEIEIIPEAVSKLRYGTVVWEMELEAQSKEIDFAQGAEELSIWRKSCCLENRKVGHSKR